jgi:hypothetical protein
MALTVLLVYCGIDAITASQNDEHKGIDFIFHRLLNYLGNNTAAYINFVQKFRPRHNFL